MTQAPELNRFSPYAIDGGADAYAEMEEDEFGDYVNYEDHVELVATQAATIAKLVEATTYARNRLEMLASDSWNIDGRDLKRNLQGVFAEYDEAITSASSTTEGE